MFTGIVSEVGTVEDVVRGGDGARLVIVAGLAGGLRPGDSVAVDGVCLTAVEAAGGRFVADVMNQTLSVTALAELEPGAAVNLEPALRAGDPLGGHIVQGHVDGVAEVRDARADGFARRLRLGLPGELARYVVERGSVALAGVSLTVAALAGDEAEVSLVPETLERTTLGAAGAGARLNLEVDVVARYVERLLESREEGNDG